MNLREKTIVAIATGGGAGWSPVAPGTCGALVGLIPCYFLAFLPLSVGLAALSLFILLAIPIARSAESILGSKDPGCIVIDEIAGMLVTMVGLPFTPLYALVGFTLFRVFDITKPFPVRYIHHKLTGGAGVVLDDVAAGVIAHLCLRLLMLLPPFATLP